MPGSLSSMAFASVELIAVSLAVFMVTPALLSAVRVPAAPRIMIARIVMPAIAVFFFGFRVFFSAINNLRKMIISMNDFTVIFNDIYGKSE
jgi:hypothetical protein